VSASGVITRGEVEDWIGRYERAWRTAGTEPLGGLFVDDATYRMSPYEELLVGIPAIAKMWEAEREGPDEVFAMASEIVAVEGQTAVVRVAVSYGEPVTQEYRDLWVIRFAEDGRATAFEEWPFWPDQPYAPAGH
jgi:hypothetical protein